MPAAIQVVAEFKTFREDQRPGRLMMCCLTPYVRKDTAMTSFAMAHRVLESHCPEAICLMVHGRGVNAIFKDPRQPDCSKGQGMVMHEEEDAEWQNLDSQTQRQHLTRCVVMW